MPIKAILFDLDGTLVDSNDLHVAAWEEAFARHGHHVDRKRIRSQIGKGGDTFVPSLLPDLPEDEQEALADAHGEVFQGRFLDRVKPFPGARDLLRRVHDGGLKVALASSAAQKELDHYVGLLNARDLIDATTAADDVETSKPAPDIVAVALKKLGVAADEALFVGDTPYDVESGAGAGVATVAVLSGGFDRVALAGAKAVYDDAAALAMAFPAWVASS
jgi:membrane protein